MGLINKENARIYSQTYRNKRKLLGLCIRCNKPSQKRRCKVCREKEGHYSKSRIMKAKRQGICISCAKRKSISRELLCLKCKETKKNNSRNSRQRRWNIIKTFLGTVCHCCGEDKESLLTLAHLNNDGAEEKRTYNNSRDNRAILSRLYRLALNKKSAPK